MAVSRRACLFAAPAALLAGRARAADPAGGPSATVARFYDALLAVMKIAKHTPFEQRYQRLAPIVMQTFNLALMTRLAVGPDWTKLQTAQQQAVSDAFARYTVAVYAGRFDDFNGERFEVDPTPVNGPNGPVVRSSMTKSDGDKVVLDYLMRQGGDGAWQVIDVYLSGTISELATRRSEFTGVIQQSGADGLVRLLDERIAALRAG